VRDLFMRQPYLKLLKKSALNEARNSTDA
jgi:hypothetical protein